MKERSGKSVTITITSETVLRIVFILLGLALLFYIREIVAIVLVAVLLAALINPFANRMEKFKVPRFLSVLVIYAAILSAIVGAVYFIVPTTVTQVQQIGDKYAPFFAELAERQPLVSQVVSGEILQQDLESLIAQLRESGLYDAYPAVLGILSEVFGGVLTIFLVVVIAFYMVVERDRMRKMVEDAPIGEKYKHFLREVFPKVQLRIGGWLRGQLLIMLAIFVLVYVALSIIGVPFALILALIAGLLEVIPFLGPNLAAIPAVLIAFSVSPIMALIVVITYFVIQQIESDFLSPQVYKKVAGVNPIVSIIAMLIGFELFGLGGGLLAIPFCVVIGVFMEEWMLWRKSQS